MTTIVTRRGAIGSAMFAAAATPALAAEAPGFQPYVFPRSTVLPFKSNINGVDYALYVRPPLGHGVGDKHYPVILTLDADYQFTIAANHLEHLAGRMNQAPEAIVVSIAYPGVYPDRARYQMERSRDYTPVFSADGGYGPAFQARSGGGPAFLRVIAEEVLPRVAADWRADLTDVTFVGHSYGGLFGSWVLQTSPALFRRYLLVSPSLWYADEMILKAETPRPARLPRRTSVYLAVGDDEEQPQNGSPMVSQLRRFAKLLKARKDPNLIVESRVFVDETHASIFPPAFSTGVRHLFNQLA